MKVCYLLLAHVIGFGGEGGLGRRWIFFHNILVLSNIHITHFKIQSLLCFSHAFPLAYGCACLSFWTTLWLQIYSKVYYWSLPCFPSLLVWMFLVFFLHFLYANFQEKSLSNHTPNSKKFHKSKSSLLLQSFFVCSYWFFQTISPTWMCYVM
jgi:hypothetical protein